MTEINIQQVNNIQGTDNTSDVAGAAAVTPGYIPAEVQSAFNVVEFNGIDNVAVSSGVSTSGASQSGTVEQQESSNYIMSDVPETITAADAADGYDINSLAEVSRANMFVDLSTASKLLVGLKDKGVINDGMTEEQLVLAINSYVGGNYSYIADTGDKWNTVAETINNGGGDCEDLANLEASLIISALMDRGMSKEDADKKISLFVAVNPNTFIGHVYVKYTVEDGSVKYLNPVNSSVSSAISSSLIPLFGYNADQVNMINKDFDYSKLSTADGSDVGITIPPELNIVYYTPTADEIAKWNLLPDLTTKANNLSTQLETLIQVVDHICVNYPHEWEWMRHQATYDFKNKFDDFAVQLHLVSAYQSPTWVQNLKQLYNDFVTMIDTDVLPRLAPGGSDENAADYSYFVNKVTGEDNMKNAAGYFLEQHLAVYEAEINYLVGTSFTGGYMEITNFQDYWTGRTAYVDVPHDLQIILNEIEKMFAPDGVSGGWNAIGGMTYYSQILSFINMINTGNVTAANAATFKGQMDAFKAFLNSNVLGPEGGTTGLNGDVTDAQKVYDDVAGILDPATGEYTGGTLPPLQTAYENAMKTAADAYNAIIEPYQNMKIHVRRTSGGATTDEADTSAQIDEYKLNGDTIDYMYYVERIHSDDGGKTHTTYFEWDTLTDIGTYRNQGDSVSYSQDNYVCHVTRTHVDVQTGTTITNEWDTADEIQGFEDQGDSIHYVTTYTDFKDPVYVSIAVLEPAYNNYVTMRSDQDAYNNAYALYYNTSGDPNNTFSARANKGASSVDLNGSASLLASYEANGYTLTMANWTGYDQIRTGYTTATTRVNASTTNYTHYYAEVMAKDDAAAVLQPLKDKALTVEGYRDNIENGLDLFNDTTKANYAASFTQTKDYMEAMYSSLSSCEYRMQSMADEYLKAYDAMAYLNAQADYTYWTNRLWGVADPKSSWGHWDDGSTFFGCLVGTGASEGMLVTVDGQSGVLVHDEKTFRIFCDRWANTYFAGHPAPSAVNADGTYQMDSATFFGITDKTYLLSSQGLFTYLNRGKEEWKLSRIPLTSYLAGLTVYWNQLQTYPRIEATQAVLVGNYHADTFPLPAGQDNTVANHVAAFANSMKVKFMTADTAHAGYYVVVEDKFTELIDEVKFMRGFVTGLGIIYEAKRDLRALVDQELTGETGGLKGMPISQLLTKEVNRADQFLQQMIIEVLDTVKSINKAQYSAESLALQELQAKQDEQIKHYNWFESWFNEDTTQAQELEHSAAYHEGMVAVEQAREDSENQNMEVAARMLQRTGMNFTGMNSQQIKDAIKNVLENYQALDRATLSKDDNAGYREVDRERLVEMRQMLVAAVAVRRAFIAAQRTTAEMRNLAHEEMTQVSGRKSNLAAAEKMNEAEEQAVTQWFDELASALEEKVQAENQIVYDKLMAAKEREQAQTIRDNAAMGIWAKWLGLAAILAGILGTIFLGPLGGAILAWGIGAMAGMAAGGEKYNVANADIAIETKYNLAMRPTQYPTTTPVRIDLGGGAGTVALDNPNINVAANGQVTVTAGAGVTIGANGSVQVTLPNGAVVNIGTVNAQNVLTPAGNVQVVNGSVQVNTAMVTLSNPNVHVVNGQVVVTPGAGVTISANGTVQVATANGGMVTIGTVNTQNVPATAGNAPTTAGNAPTTAGNAPVTGPIVITPAGNVQIVNGNVQIDTSTADVNSAILGMAGNAENTIQDVFTQMTSENYLQYLKDGANGANGSSGVDSAKMATAMEQIRNMDLNLLLADTARKTIADMRSLVHMEMTGIGGRTPSSMATAAMEAVRGQQAFVANEKYMTISDMNVSNNQKYEQERALRFYNEIKTNAMHEIWYSFIPIVGAALGMFYSNLEDMTLQKEMAQETVNAGNLNSNVQFSEDELNQLLANGLTDTGGGTIAVDYQRVMDTRTALSKNFIKNSVESSINSVARQLRSIVHMEMTEKPGAAEPGFTDQAIMVQFQTALQATSMIANFLAEKAQIQTRINDATDQINKLDKQISNLWNAALISIYFDLILAAFLPWGGLENLLSSAQLLGSIDEVFISVATTINKYIDWKYEQNKTKMSDAVSNYLRTHETMDESVNSTTSRLEKLQQECVDEINAGLIQDIGRGYIGVNRGISAKYQRIIEQLYNAERKKTEVQEELLQLRNAVHEAMTGVSGTASSAALSALNINEQDIKAKIENMFDKLQVAVDKWNQVTEAEQAAAKAEVAYWTSVVTTGLQALMVMISLFQQTAGAKEKADANAKLTDASNQLDAATQTYKLDPSDANKQAMDMAQQSVGAKQANLDKVNAMVGTTDQAKGGKWGTLDYCKLSCRVAMALTKIISTWQEEVLMNKVENEREGEISEKGVTTEEKSSKVISENMQPGGFAEFGAEQEFVIGQSNLKLQAQINDIKHKTAMNQLVGQSVDQIMESTYDFGVEYLQNRKKSDKEAVGYDRDKAKAAAKEAAGTPAAKEVVGTPVRVPGTQTTFSLKKAVRDDLLEQLHNIKMNVDKKNELFTLLNKDVMNSDDVSKLTGMVRDLVNEAAPQFDSVKLEPKEKTQPAKTPTNVPEGAAGTTPAPVQKQTVSGKQEETQQSGMPSTTAQWLGKLIDDLIGQVKNDEAALKGQAEDIQKQIDTLTTIGKAPETQTPQKTATVEDLKNLLSWLQKQMHATNQKLSNAKASLSKLMNTELTKIQQAYDAMVNAVDKEKKKVFDKIKKIEEQMKDLVRLSKSQPGNKAVEKRMAELTKQLLEHAVTDKNGEMYEDILGATVNATKNKGQALQEEINQLTADIGNQKIQMQGVIRAISDLKKLENNSVDTTTAMFETPEAMIS